VTCLSIITGLSRLYFNDGAINVIRRPVTDQPLRTNYGQEDREIRLRFLAEEVFFSKAFRPALQPTQPPTASGLRSSLPEGKAAGTWSWSDPHLVHKLRLSGAKYPPSKRLHDVVLEDCNKSTLVFYMSFW